MDKNIVAPLVVTSYTEPDLDGFSCAVAYAEYLNKTGTPAVVRMFGTPHIEATYLVKKIGFEITEDQSAPLGKVALVDASELRDLNAFVKPDDVIEIIDHRAVNDAALFKNAKIQIELVGAAATLVAEKFHAAGVEISPAAATLLYGAIVSNTLNFRTQITTERDRQMATWLISQLKLPENFIDDMFRAKSDVTGEKLAERIDSDFAWFAFGDKKIGCAQLEIMDANSLVQNRRGEVLAILETLKSKYSLDAIFASLIDLGEGCNIFITADPWMQKNLSEILNIHFENNSAIRPDFIMRKEIVPLLKKALEIIPTI